MKDPFAKKDVEEFRYPAPLDREVEETEGEDRARAEQQLRDLIDPEVTAAIESGEEAPWVKVRVPRAIGDINAIADYTQMIVSPGANGDGSVRARIKSANRGVFGLLVEEWSFTSRKPTPDDYEKLDEWAGAWINQVLGEVQRRGGVGKVRTSSESPKTSSGERAPSRSGSARAKPSA